TTPTQANVEPANAAADRAGAAPSKLDEALKAPPQTDTDPMRDLLEHLRRAQPLVANIQFDDFSGKSGRPAVDRDLAQTIQQLTGQGTDPEQRAKPEFRHQVAYALQDLEKSLWPVPMAPELRTEMTRLAATAPGLQNERMQALMRATASLEDQRLIRD